MKLLYIFTILPLTWGSKNILPLIKMDLKELDKMADFSHPNVQTKWLTVPLDNFNQLDTRNFQMRYMINEQHFGGPGNPIFIFVGGEWSISAGWLLAGNIYKMAEENRGCIVYTEHRYYGETQPFPNQTPENLRFLSADQALADLALFITQMKQDPKYIDSKVILYGPSYAGNLAVWFRQRYPHLVEGAIASGSPIKAKLDFYEFLELTEWSLRSEGGQSCINIIREGIQQVAHALTNPDGRQQLSNIFNLCGTLTTNPLDIGFFSAQISSAFMHQVQSAYPGSLIALCNKFHTEEFGVTPIEKLAGFLDWMVRPVPCRQFLFQDLLNLYRNDQVFFSWVYQMCTEMGYFQIVPTSGTMFDSLHHVNLNFYQQLCKQLYSDRFTKEFTSGAVNRTNLMFGGLNPQVNNTINIHGELDPWRALGVHDRDLSCTSPSFNIPRASHCFDIFPWRPTDTIRMTGAQQRLRRIVRSWLS